MHISIREVANVVFYDLLTGETITEQELREFKFMLRSDTNRTPEIYFSGLYPQWGELNSNANKIWDK